MVTEYFGTNGQRVVIKYMQDNHLLNAVAMYKKRLEVVKKISSGHTGKYESTLEDLIASLQTEIKRRNLV